MSTPINIIAQAIRVADGSHTLGAGALAEVVANTLTHKAIVDNATHALIADGWRGVRVGDDNLPHLVRAVLGSVGGAS